MSIHKEVLVTTRHKLMCNKCGEETVEQHKYPLVTYENSNQEEQ